MKSVALHNLGCKVNAYELDVMRQYLLENGYKIVPFDEIADIYIINTCTVTNIADRKSRQMLHRAKARNPEAVVVAVGCYVQTGTQKIETDESIDLAIGNNKKKDLIPLLEAYLQQREQDRHPDSTLQGSTLTDIGRTEEYERMTLRSTTEHTRAYIKIQDGCNQFCSYCVIPYARGRVRSRRPEDILEEIKGLARLGYREVVLTGIHISSYGIDFIQKESADYLAGEAREEALRRGLFLELIQAVHEVEGIERIRLGSLEPRIITQEFAQALSRLSKVCPHFHLSLQSGSDSVLKRMNRHYNTSEYYEKVQLLRESFEDPAITTDIIVGFPQETEEEFEETRHFLERIGFYEMHIFKYSRRFGTAADRMPGQIDEQEKARRSHILLELEQEQSAAYRRRMIGKSRPVLLEESRRIDGRTYMTGHTPEYVKTALCTQEDLSGQVREIMIQGFLKKDIMI